MVVCSSPPSLQEVALRGAAAGGSTQQWDVMASHVLPRSERTLQMSLAHDSSNDNSVTCVHRHPGGEVVWVGWTDGRVDVMHLGTSSRVQVIPPLPPLTTVRNAPAPEDEEEEGDDDRHHRMNALDVVPTAIAHVDTRDLACVVIGYSDGRIRVCGKPAGVGYNTKFGPLFELPRHDAALCCLAASGEAFGAEPSCLLSVCEHGDVKQWVCAEEEDTYARARGHTARWRLCAYYQVGC